MNLKMNHKFWVRVIAGVLLLSITFFIYWHRFGSMGDSEITLEDRTPNQGVVEGEGEELSGGEGRQIQKQEETQGGKEDQVIVVDVSGAVNQPAVLELPAGTRVYKAVEAAGGLRQDGDTRSTNLAAELTDGMKLYIPTKKEIESGINYGNVGSSSNASVSSPAGSSTSGNKIDINRADSQELQRLTGVGPATAEKIIDYRKQYGRFQKTEEIMNVSGIGEKTFEKIKEMICVE